MTTALSLRRVLHILAASLLVMTIGRATEDDVLGRFTVRADFDGDGVVDALRLPHGPLTSPVLTYGNGRHAWTPGEDWLGLDWRRSASHVTAADLDGNGGDDLLMQPRSLAEQGSLLLADPQGRFPAVAQTLPADHLGFDWTVGATRIVAGDFDGNGRSELLLQAHDPMGVFYVIHTDETGRLTHHGQGWIDDYLDERWSTSTTTLHAADFDGDRRADILLQPTATLAGGRPEDAHYALVLADADGRFTKVAQRWGLDELGAEWDPLTHELRVGDIDGDGIADLWLKSRNPKGYDYLLTGTVRGFQGAAARWNDGKTPAEALARARGTQPSDRSGVIVVPAETTMAVETSEAPNKKIPDAHSEAPQGASILVGYTSGEFSVDPTGAANYRIPLWTPPGVAGMQPDLAFLYSSRGGNGQLGAGWSLAGLSSIARCPMTPAQDFATGDPNAPLAPGAHFDGVDFDASDRLCLDGKRLVTSSADYWNAAGYSTEIASYQKITPSGTYQVGDGSASPSSFIVEDKTGLIREYGASDDSRIEVRGRPGSAPISVWAIKKIRDRKGNYIEFQYAESDEGEYWLEQVSWHSKHGYQAGKAVFVYGFDRTDARSGYLPGGGRFALTRTLTLARIYARNTLARTYELSYAPNPHSGLYHLTEVQECSYAKGSPECLRPTRFEWEFGAAGFNVGQGFEFPLATPSHRIGDVDGDGRGDLVRSIYDGNVYLCLETCKQDGHASWQQWPASNLQPGFSSNQDEWLVLDYDGDGKDDIAAWDSTGNWAVLRSTGVQFVYVSTDVAHQVSHPATKGEALVVDVNGDGLDEVLYRDKDDDELYLLPNGPSGFQAPVPLNVTADSKTELRVVEYDGDGRPDVLVTRNEPCTTSCPSALGVLRNTGTSFSHVVAGNLDTQWDGSITVVDVNGDGLSDLLYGSTSEWKLKINTGAGFVAADLNDFAPDNHEFVYPFDHNRDGRTDLLYKDDSQVWRLVLSTGDNFGSPENAAFVSTLVGDPYAGVMAYDADGDGATDLFAIYSVCCVARRSIGGNVTNGLLKSVTKGAGGEGEDPGDRTEVWFWPLSKPFTYQDSEATAKPLYEAAVGDDPTPHTLATPEYRPFNGPLYVVRSYTVDSGALVDSASSARARVSTEMHYAGAASNNYGRGFAGFRRVYAVNHNAGTVTYNYHRQDFPFTGMVEHAVQKSQNDFVQAVPDGDGETWQCISDDPYEPDACLYERPQSAVPASSPALVSQTNNTFGSYDLAGSDYVYERAGKQVYLTETEVKHHRFATDASLYKIERSQFAYDRCGNAASVIVQTTDASGGDLHKVTTTNTYLDQGLGLCLGRLETSTVLHQRPSYGTSNRAGVQGTRRSTFGYATDSHLLTRETIDSTDGPDLTREYELDAFGNRVRETITGPGVETGRTTQTLYDSNGQYATSVVNALGQTETRTWDRILGVVTSVTGPNGLTTTSQHDAFGRKAQEIAPRQTVVTDTVYRWCSDEACVSPAAVYKVRTNASDGSEVTTEHDLLGREVLTTRWGLSPTPQVGPVQVRTETRYDSFGRAYATSLPHFVGQEASRCWVWRRYDALNQVTLETAPAKQDQCAGAVPESNQSPAGNLKTTATTYDGLIVRVQTRVTPPEAGGAVEYRVIERELNTMGRLRAVRELDGAGDVLLGSYGSDNAVGIQTLYDYDAFGNTTWVRPPHGVPTHIAYDDRGFRRSMEDPDMGVWVYDYNALGELVSQTDAKGQATTMQHDLLGRLKSRTEPEGTTTWTYDSAYGKGVGKPALVVGPDGYLEAYEYDEYGAPTDTIRVIDNELFWVTQTYDALGRADVTIYPDVQSFAVGGAPLQPTLSVTAIAATGQPRLSWTTSNDTALYKLYRYPEGESEATAAEIYSGSRTGYDDKVAAEGRYYYVVKACHGATNCTSSNTVFIDVDLPLAAPAYLNVPVADADGTFALAWGPSESGATYELFEAKDSAAFGATPAWSGAGVANADGSRGAVLTGRADGDYRYEIRACMSGACSVRVPGGNAVAVDEPAGAPTALNLPPFSATYQFTVGWDPSSTAATSRHLAYELKETAPSGDVRIVYRGPSTSTAVTVAASGIYTYSVRACNGDVEAMCSAHVTDSLSVGPAPSPLTSMSVTPAPSLDGGFAVNWNGSVGDASTGGILRYDVDESTVGDFASTTRFTNEGSEEPCQGGAETCQVPPALARAFGDKADGVTYFYRARACGQWSCSDWFPTANANGVNTVKVTKAPGIPGGPITAASPILAGTAFSISWSAASGIVTAYEVREQSAAVNGTAEFPASVVVEPSVTAASKPLPGKAIGDYFYWVRACHDTACSPWSATSVPVKVRNLPAAPTGVALPASSGDGSVNLNWNALDSYNNEVVTSFEAERATTATFNAGTITAVPVTGTECIRYDFEIPTLCVQYGPKSEVSVSGLPNGEHWFRVHACSSLGCGAWAAAPNSVAVARAPAAPGTPSVPSGWLGLAFNVSWAATPDDFSHYVLERSTDASTWTAVSPNPTTNSASVTVPAAGDYTFRVRACKTVASYTNCGANSGVSSAALARVPPDAPTGLTLPSSSTTGSFTFDWAKRPATSPQGITRFDAEEATNATFTQNVTAFQVNLVTPSSMSPTSTDDECIVTENIGDNPPVLTCMFESPKSQLNLVNRGNGDRHYRVRACAPWGCGAWASTGMPVDVAKTPGTPGAPQGPAGYITVAGYDVTWTASTGEITAYELQEVQSSIATTSAPASGWTAVTPNGTANQKPIAGNKPEGNYFYRIRACYESSCTAYATSTAPVQVRQAPAAPASISSPASDYDGAYQVSWGAVGGAVNAYRLFEATNSNFTGEQQLTVGGTYYCASGQYNQEGDCLEDLSFNPNEYLDVSGRANGTYYYRVQACRPEGLCSGYTASSAVAVTLPPPQPAAPTGPSFDTDGAYALNWTAVSGPVSEYRLYEDNAQIYAGTALTQAVSGRANGVHSYKVAACNVAGCGSQSAAASVEVTLPPGLPGAPGAATDPVTATSYTVSWAAPSSGVVTRYELYESTSSGTLGTKIYDNSTTPSFAVSGKANNTTYWYQVRACNQTACGDYRQGSVTVRLAPGATSTPTSSESPSLDGSYTVSWTAPSGTPTYYVLEESSTTSFTTLLNTYTPSGTSQALSGLGEGVRYYRVKACNTVATACGGYSGTLGVNTTLPPGAPGTVTLPASPDQDGGYTVSWGAASGTVSKYTVQEATNSAFTANLVSTDVTSGTSLSVSGKGNNVYYYRVAACRTGVGCSSFSTASGDVKVALTVGAPTISPSPSVNGGYTVSWSAVAGSPTYDVQWATNSGFTAGVGAASASTATSYAVNGQSNGAYWYRVRSCTASGASCSNWGTATSVNVYLPPTSAPGTPTISPSPSVNGAFTASWTAPSGNYTYYEAQEAGVSDFSSGVTTNTPTTASQSYSGKPNGTRYVRVRGCNTVATACGAWSATASVAIHLPPGTPGTPSISPSPSVNGAFTATWTAPSGSYTYYEVQEAGVSDFSSAVTTNTPTTASQSYSGKPNGTRYVRVRGCNTVATACGAWSATASVAVHLPPGTPGAPSISPSPSVNGAFTATWTAASGNVTYYEVQEAGVSDFSSGVTTNTPTTASQSYSGKPNGTRYVRVRGCNTVTTACGAWSATASVAVYLPPGTPGTPSLSPSPSTNGSFTATWTAASGNVTYYEVQEAGVSNFASGVTTNTPTTASQSYSGKPEGTRYVRVRGCNTVSTACGAWSATTSVNVALPPGTPGAVTLPASPDADGSYTVSWGAASGVVSTYTLEEATNASFTAGLVTNDVATTSLALSGRGTNTYYYRVKACRTGVGCSGYSTASGDVKVTLTPAAASVNPATSGDGSYALIWGAVGGAPTYEVQEATNSGFTAGLATAYSGTATSAGVSGKGNGTYYYRARSCTGGVCGAWSGTGSVTVALAPSMPSSISVSPTFTTSGNFTVNWGASTGTVTAYQLEESANGSSWALAYSGTALSKAFSRGGATVEYSYRVRACNGSSSCSAYRGTATVWVEVEPECGPLGCALNEPKRKTLDPTEADVERFAATDAPRASAVKVAATAAEGFKLMSPTRLADVRKGAAAGRERSAAGAAFAAISPVKPRRADAYLEALYAARVAGLTRQGRPGGFIKVAAPRIAKPGATAATAGKTPSVPTLSSLAKPAEVYTHRVRHVYGARGHLICVREGVSAADCASSSGTVYWRADAGDALGHVTQERLGNGLTTQRAYDRALGTLTSLKAGTNAGFDDVQNLAFGWDLVGNLKSRSDAHLNVQETFTYDPLHRLSTVTTVENGGAPQVVSQSYDAAGNVLNIGTAATGYEYASGRPHAVTEVTKAGVAHTYAYDANGNLATVTTSGGEQRRVCWSSANFPVFIGGAGSVAADCTAATPSASVWSRFQYDPSRARYKQVHHAASGDETTTYVGSLYERVTKPGGLVEHRHYIRGAGRVVALHTRFSDATAPKTEYWHRDQLDSIVVRTDANGAVIANSRVRYDAWGTKLSGTSDKRGYTGHEMLEDLGLIHMNGRVYDPGIGRFLSADPLVAFPASTQGFNRYTYVGNNPLSYNDPSGYSEQPVTIPAYAPPMPTLTLVDPAVGFLSLPGSQPSSFANPLPTIPGIEPGVAGLLQFLGQTPSGGRSGDGSLERRSSSNAGSQGPKPTDVAATTQAVTLAGTASAIGGGKSVNGGATSSFVLAVDALHKAIGYGSPGSKDPTWHHYDVVTTGCSTSAAACSLGIIGGDVVMNFSYPNLRLGPAPFAADGRPVVVFGAGLKDNPEPADFLMPSGRVTQSLNPRAFIVTNTTLEDHVFFPGDISRGPIQLGNTIYIVTHGAGTNSFTGIGFIDRFLAQKNQEKGPEIFKMLDQQALKYWEQKYEPR